MKKLILTTAALLFFLNVFAQEEASCLFIGRYNTDKSFMCSPRAWISEGVSDYKEYALKSKQFTEKHKPNNPSTEFVSAKECVMVYEYKKKISGFDCKPLVQGIIKAATLEKCEEQFKILIVKNANEHASPPNIIFSWCGKGLQTSQKKTITTDYGGVNGKFTLIKKPSGGDFFVAQLTNNTKDKIATVLIRTNTGDLIIEELAPGSTLTKKYDIKTIEIKVIYRKASEPKQSFDFIKVMKENTHEILEINNGQVIKKKWDATCMCIRG